MDRLARNAMLAKQAGMSYGQWKALQPIATTEPKQEIPDGWRSCQVCGKLFKPKGGGQRFCEPACRDSAYYIKKKKIRTEYMRRYRLEKKAKMEG